jgi:hypothetical protein
MTTLKSGKDRKNRPAWVVEIPECHNFCLAGKIHTVRSALPDDVGSRELLTWESDFSKNSAQSILQALRLVIHGTFAPSNDPLPAGTIVRNRYGIDRVVLATVALDTLYGVNDPLAITVFLGEYPATTSDDNELGFVRLPDTNEMTAVTDKSLARYVDLIETRTLQGERLRKRVVGKVSADIVQQLRESWLKLLPSPAGKTP